MHPVRRRLGGLGGGAVTAELVSVESAAGLPGTLADRGYALPPGLPYEDWERAGLSLRFMHRNINWWVGDWLAYGEREYGERAYQATLDNLAQLMGREADTLGQCAWVASRFPPPTRVDNLSWSHHRAVLLAGLTPEVGGALLTDAVANRWTVAELADQAAAMAVTIEAQAAGGSSVPAGGTDTDGDELPEVQAGPWYPTVDDLTPEARQAMTQAAARHKVQPLAAQRLWVAALYWAEARDCFTVWGGA